MLYKPTIAQIDLGAIEHNIRQVKRLVGPGVRICPAVKADGYGHGAVQVSRVVLQAGADMLCIATVDEGAELRNAGIEAPLLLLGCLFPEQISQVLAYGITVMVCDLAFALELSRQSVLAGRRTRVHIKVDTGMGRVGVQVREMVEFATALAAMPGIDIEGVFTHFPTADTDPEFTARQTEEFRDVCDALVSAGIPVSIRHAANSAAVISSPDSHFDMVRPGIMIYGLYDDDSAVRTVDLHQAMTLKTRIAFLKELAPGRSVSYGRTFVAERRTRVATIPIGYGDGYSRSLSNRGCVLVGGMRVPIIGRVCMDQTMIDVTDVPGVAVGDDVVLYGRQGDELISIEEIASLLGTISYEVVCSVSKRVARVYSPAG